MNNEKITETYDVLKTFIQKEDIYLNEPMSKHTTFKIGGNADILLFGSIAKGKYKNRSC